MTATTTPRLGLLSPTNTDDFLPEDFVDTMNKLDGRPGILPVANYASLPSGLTSAHHGSIFAQLDNGAMWMWVRPGSAAGAWRRINSMGRVFYQVQSASVSTTQTDEDNSATLISGSYTSRGGRNSIIVFTHQYITNSSAYGGSRTTLYHDNAVVDRSYQWSGKANAGVSHRMLQPLGVTTPGSVHTVKVTLGSFVTGGSGTTTADTRGELHVIEL